MFDSEKNPNRDNLYPLSSSRKKSTLKPQELPLTAALKHNPQSHLTNAAKKEILKNRLVGY